MIKSNLLILVTEEKMIFEQAPVLGLSLATGIISAYLESKGIEVKIHDTNKIASSKVYEEEELELIKGVYDKDKIINYIKSGNDEQIDRLVEMFLPEDWQSYDSYGVSIGADFSMLQIHLGFYIARYLKKSGKAVFVGGNNITYLYIFKDIYGELLQALVENFSFIIKGPGERTIAEIIEGLNNGPLEDLSQIPGLLRWEQGEVIANREHEPLVVEPSWNSLELKDYSYPFDKNEKENDSVYYKFPLHLMNKIIEFKSKKVENKKIIIPYIFNFNCTYNCAFCTQSDKDRSGFIVQEVNRVIDEIESLSSKYESNYFYFLNNYFPSSMQFIREFNEGLKRRNLKIKWADCGRANGLTLEKLQLLKESGCQRLVFGFESGSPKILELIDKRLDLEELKRVLRWCKEVGILADLEVIIGLPYEREEDFMCTYNFIKDHKALINNFWLNEYFVVPNSLIGKHPEKYGVELLKKETTYNEILNRNREAFEKRNYNDFTANARLYAYNEINENDTRDYSQIKVENADKMRRLLTLKNPEFEKLFNFYNKMAKLRGK